MAPGIRMEKFSSRCRQRPVRMQVMVKSARRYLAEFTADRRDTACLVCHEILGVAQPLGCHQPRAAALAATSTAGRDAFTDALSDQVAFHIGEGRLDPQEGTTCRCCGIELTLEGAKNDPAA